MLNLKKNPPLAIPISVNFYEKTFYLDQSVKLAFFL
jgi:hypothetical protein